MNIAHLLSFAWAYLRPILTQLGVKVSKQLVNDAYAYIQEVELHRPKLTGAEKKAWVLAKLKELNIETGVPVADHWIHWAFEVAFGRFQHEQTVSAGKPTVNPPQPDYYYQILAELPAGLKSDDVVYENAARQFFVTHHGVGGFVPPGFIQQAQAKSFPS